MMYLQNIIRFCAFSKIRFEGSKYYLDELEFDTFIAFFSYIDQMYSFSETTTYIDWEFEYMSNTASDAIDKHKISDDVEFLGYLLSRAFEDMGRNQALDTIMAKIYWCVKTGNIDSAWASLAAYAHQAAWGSR